MERYMRKIAVALLAITLFSTLATNAYASITQTRYSISTSIDSYRTISSRREKQDATPLYLEIDENHTPPRLLCPGDGVHLQWHHGHQSYVL